MSQRRHRVPEVRWVADGRPAENVEMAVLDPRPKTLGEHAYARSLRARPTMVLPLSLGMRLEERLQGAIENRGLRRSY